MAEYSLVRDRRGRVIAEYLEDYTPVVRCKDAAGNLVWRDASEMLPPPPPRPPGTPELDPRHDGYGPHFAGALLGGLLGVVCIAMIGPTPGAITYVVHSVWVLALLGIVLGHLYRRERIARWDAYVDSADGLVIEEPEAVRRYEESASCLMLMLLGPLAWIWVTERGRTRRRGRAD